MKQPLAQLTGVGKRFGPTPALTSADLVLHEGEVHGVLGENGAGKTTLLNVLAGMLSPDRGRLEIGGRTVSLRSPRDAWRAGVAMVHQHFTLVPSLTVLENLAMGRRTSALGLRLDYGGLRAEVDRVLERTGLGVPLDSRVEQLGVGDRQRVEILKALLRRPRLLVLDEPTAVLAPSEVATLFKLLRGLATQGTGVALVAHKLDEVLSVADRVTVLRGGRTVLQAARGEVDADRLTLAMVGRTDAEPAAIGHSPDRAASGRIVTTGEVVASLDGVSVRGARGERALDGVSLNVRRGEIVGVAGVEGNGQRELALVLSGRVQPTQGRVVVPEGVGFIPQDRTHEGLVQGFELTENMALALHRDGSYRRGAFLRWAALRQRTDELLTRFDVRSQGPSTPAGALSGGNQQRVVVAREMDVSSDLLVAENPTRGLDVAATSFVHDELSRLAGLEEGPGVVLISTDLDEVLALSDRILVMVRGSLAEVPDADRTRERVGVRMLAGHRA